MHDMRVAFDVAQPLHLHGAESADTPQVVAPQIDEHVVLGQFLGVGEQFPLQPEVLLVAPAPWPRARQREGCGRTPFSRRTRVSGEAPAISMSVPDR